jgi:hypothetical protein
LNPKWHENALVLLPKSLKMSKKGLSNINNHYFQLYAQIEECIISDKTINTYTKSFALLFCILIEVVVNVDNVAEVAFYKESCETLIANYFHHLCAGLQTGSIAESADFKELCGIVSLIQSDIAKPSSYNKKMIIELVSSACLD